MAGGRPLASRKIELEESQLPAVKAKLGTHKAFVTQAVDVEDFLRTKYTSKELYAWLDSTYGAFHF